MAPAMAVGVRLSGRLATRLVSPRPVCAAAGSHWQRRGTAAEASADPLPPAPEVARPSRDQLRAHFIQSMVPMIGFGFMDNSVMIWAGSAIDATLGVHLGLSTMCAAACGQVCSDMAGVSFGGVIAGASTKLGLPSPRFDDDQRELNEVKRVGVLGSVLGVFLGCSLGLTNLIFVDTEQARELKLAAKDERDGTEFTIRISNTENDKYTSIFVEGPATKGLVASVTAVLSVEDLAIQGIMAGQTASLGAWKRREVMVTKDGEQVEDAKLESLARKVLRACREPEQNAKAAMELQAVRRENEELQRKLLRLQARLEEVVIVVSRRDGAGEHPSLEEAAGVA